MEEILDCIDLVQGNEYYIKFYFDNPNNILAIKFSEKYNGIYKLIEEKIPIKNLEDNNRHFYELINENNLKLNLVNYNLNMDNNYEFYCEIFDELYLQPYTCHCKIYKIHNTEYVLK